MIGFDLAEARDFLALLGAMVFGTLKFMVTAGVMAASLHLFLLILHRKRKGFTVSFQLVCYSQGVSSLMSMVVTISDGRHQHGRACGGDHLPVGRRNRRTAYQAFQACS